MKKHSKPVKTHSADSKITVITKQHFNVITKSLVWFFIGAILGIFLLISFVYIFFAQKYSQRVYPGVAVAGIPFSDKTQEEVQAFFERKNAQIGKTKFVFKSEARIATISAKDIRYGYNEQLLSQQTYSIGRTQDILSNISTIAQAYIYGINLPPTYHYSKDSLEKELNPLIKDLSVKPVNALFQFENGKVTTFKPSSSGQEADMEKLHALILSEQESVFSKNPPVVIQLTIPVKTIPPEITTEEVNNLGIKELLGSGESFFRGSIQNRIYNLTLAASRVNGILIKPGEVFSFNKVLGDVSSFTGYKQAYVIENGRTVLGDGGGVCQVSTTLFRAILNSGLPIAERHPHAYRVSYYEQESPVGFDATIFVPSIDLRFKNDTKHHLLIQSSVDPALQKLTYSIFGTSDNRTTKLSDPIISSQTPAPEPLYQDDPILPKGEVKQIDFAAAGARVSFSRTVEKDGKIIIEETFLSNYRPWQAVFLRGTKE